MFSKYFYKQFLTKLFLLYLCVSTAQATALFDGTTADAWLVDAKTGQLVGYDLGQWTEQFNASSFPGFSLSNNNVILVNHLPNSSVPMSLGQPGISLAGIGDSALMVGGGGQSGFRNLELSPKTGTYNETTAVTIQVSVALLEQASYILRWKVGTQALKTELLSFENVKDSQDGYYTKTIYLVTDGDYIVDVELSTIGGTIIETAAATYTIAVGIDQRNRDTDGDSLPDLVELDIGLNPLEDDWNADLNGDGWSELDAWIRRFCLDPVTRLPIAGDDSCIDDAELPIDSDQDNWSDFDEILRGTNPLDPEPIIEGFVSIPPTGESLPDARFCVADDIFYFNLNFKTSSPKVIFRIGADGSFASAPYENIQVDFNQDGSINGGTVPEVVTSSTSPINDRWQDGLIDDFTIESIAPNTWRIYGSVPVGANPFVAGDVISSIDVDVISESAQLDPVTVSEDRADCEPAFSTEFAEQQRLRFKDFPSISRLYEVEYQIDTGFLVAPSASVLNLDQQSQGAKQLAYGGNVIQSFVATQNNIAGVDVVVVADSANSQDDIILNIWQNTARGELLHHQTLRNVKIDQQLDTTLSFRFDAIALQMGQTYYLEIRQRVSKLASTGIDSYLQGEVLEAEGTVAPGQSDLIFTLYNDSSFADGVAGTRSNTRWQKLIAASINGKPLYQSDNMLRQNEIAQAGLNDSDIEPRLRFDVASVALFENTLPALRLPAGDSVVINAIHRFVPVENDQHDTPLGYSRTYKYWLPRMTDVTPASMLDDIGQGDWSTPDEWRRAFIAYLLPRLTLIESPQLDVNSTLPVNAIEIVLTEESSLQGLSKQQLFASSTHFGNRQFANAWEKSLRRFSEADYNLDLAITAVSGELEAGSLLADNGSWLRSTFFAGKTGTSSDTYILQQIQRNSESVCFISDANLPGLQADSVAWNTFFDRCPDYFSETKLNQYLAEDKLRNYQLRLVSLPGVTLALLADVTLLNVSQDSDADGIENEVEVAQPVDALTLPWLEDSDLDQVIDGLDPCANDAFNECSDNPILPVINVGADLTVVEPSIGEGSVIIGIQINRIYDETITVFYETLVTISDTATPGQDFTIISGSVDIAPGQLTTLIEVPIFSDADSEGEETFTFRITGVDNASLSDDGIIVITLNDPEPVLLPPTILIVDSNIIVAESNSVQLNASQSFDPSGEAITFSWQQTDTTGVLINFPDTTLSLQTFNAPAVLSSLQLEFEVTVTNESGLSSIASVSVQVDPVIFVPGNVLAVAGDTQVELSWDLVPGAIAYDVCYASETITAPDNCSVHQDGVLLIDENSPVIIAGLNNGTQYFFVVIPKDTNGNGVASVVVNAIPISASTQLMSIKKTGATVSYSGNGFKVGTGSIKDDAFYQKGVIPSYTRDDTKETVIDNITGLEWQDNNIPEVQRDFDTAPQYCLNLDLGGSTDWRLPSKKELESIANFTKDEGNGERHSYPLEFNNNISPVSAHWTSLPFANNNTLAFAVSMSHGNSVIILKTRDMNVRCVRGVSTNLNGDFSKANGIVTDNHFGLQWKDDVAIEYMGYEDAIDFCENLSLNSKNDWRLPNINELLTVVDSHNSPALNPIFQYPLTGSLDGIWSNTPATGRFDNGKMGVSRFVGNAKSQSSSQTQVADVMCVRGL